MNTRGARVAYATPEISEWLSLDRRLAPSQSDPGFGVPARYAAGVSDHSYDDDAAMTVVRLAEELVGEDAYGGAWIDQTLDQPLLGVALIAPQADHVTSIREAARRAGWSITIDLVKYSRAQLISFYDGLDGPSGNSVVGFGWDPRLNKVLVELSTPDDAAISYFREHIPEDALLLRFVPWQVVATD
jgi:hypothetical protein